MNLQKIENFEQFLKVNDKQRIVTNSRHIARCLVNVTITSSVISKH